MVPVDFSAFPSPCYLVDEQLLVHNLQVLQGVKERTGCKILLAQKAFSMFSLYPLIGQYLDGTTASGLFEARLGHEEMGGETHVFSPAYTEEELRALIPLCDHVVFNSFAQWKRFRSLVQASPRSIACGIRINPEYTEQDHAIYDPCAPYSRLGTTLANFDPEEMEGISGLHFHTLCEQNSDALGATLRAVEEKFGRFLYSMKWLNFGGGHHITRPDYDIPRLERAIRSIQEKYGLQVYLEPGEAVVLNTGYLVCTVLDIVDNGMHIAILDTSAACHMPDVIEMPYRPPLLNAGEPGELAHTYRLGGPTCLAGDILGDYSFAHALKPGDRLVFGDMAHYSMVKNNTFNGMPLPAIGIWNESGSRIVKQFSYEDFRMRLS